jgi:flagellar biosynthesis protein FliR
VTGAIEQLLHFLPTAFLAIARVSGLAIYGPLVGSPAVPVQIKALLVAALGLITATVIPPAAVELTLLELAPRMAGEVLVGLVIGFVASLPMMTAQLAGLITGQQLGLGFAMIYNPAADTEADSVGQLLFFLTLVTFISIGGLEATFIALLRSFDHLPAGHGLFGENLVWFACDLLTASVEVALRISAPLLAIVFLETVTMGFLAKTMPQLNMLNIGFPIRILLGLAMLAVGLFVMHGVFVDDIIETLDRLALFLKGAAAHG